MYPIVNNLKDYSYLCKLEQTQKICKRSGTNSYIICAKPRKTAWIRQLIQAYFYNRLWKK